MWAKWPINLLSGGEVKCICCGFERNIIEPDGAGWYEKCKITIDISIKNKRGPYRT